MNFTNVEEAQTLLGRDLTGAETLWFNFTNGVPDYQLYSLTALLLMLMYPIACLPYFVLDCMKLPFFEQFRLQPSVPHTPAATWQAIRSVMITFTTVVVPLQIMSYPFFKFAGVNSDLPFPTLTTVALQLLVFFLIEDYGNYWIHRMFHWSFLYEKFHYLHHEYTSPLAASATYAHWVEILVLGVPTLIGPTMVKCHVVTLWLWILIRQMEAIETHSGYDFPWSFTRLVPFYGGAHFHDYHHQVGGQCSGNFASIFTVCDWVYGTDKGYRKKQEILKMKKDQ